MSVDDLYFDVRDTKSLRMSMYTIKIECVAINYYVQTLVFSTFVDFMFSGIFITNYEQRVHSEQMKLKRMELETPEEQVYNHEFESEPIQPFCKENRALGNADVCSD